MLGPRVYDSLLLLFYQHGESQTRAPSEANIDKLGILLMV